MLSLVIVTIALKTYHTKLSQCEIECTFHTWGVVGNKRSSND